jgi:hypothetical protein
VGRPALIAPMIKPTAAIYEEYANLHAQSMIVAVIPFGLGDRVAKWDLLETFRFHPRRLDRRRFGGCAREASLLTNTLAWRRRRHVGTMDGVA